MNLSAIEDRNDTMLLNSNEVADDLLVSAAQSGDSKAFFELTKRHSRMLLFKAYQITRNWQDAEDVVQDSFMKAFTHLHTFESRSRFSTWFTRIAINSALMWLRKSRIQAEADAFRYSLCLHGRISHSVYHPKCLSLKLFPFLRRLVSVV